jgi:hypothetical protein
LKNKNILKHIPFMMRRRWVVRFFCVFKCKCESIHKKPIDNQKKVSLGWPPSINTLMKK